MRLIDTHSHIDVADFAPDRAQVIERAQAAGIRDQIVPAIAAAGWPALRTVCAAHPGLHAAYGLHPVYLEHHTDAQLAQLPKWLEREACVAVGEIGLDGFVDGLDARRQQQVFEAQLAIARQFDLPVVVHARRAVEAVIATLRRYAPLRGVVHSFSGSEEQAAQLGKLGFLLGIGGPVTYARAQRLHRLVARVPLEQLLLETDSPDQPDSGWRGQRNEPARLTVVLEAVAALRTESIDAIAAQTTANAMRLFGVPPR